MFHHPACGGRTVPVHSRHRVTGGLHSGGRTRERRDTSYEYSFTVLIRRTAANSYAAMSAPSTAVSKLSFARAYSGVVYVSKLFRIAELHLYHMHEVTWQQGFTHTRTRFRGAVHWQFGLITCCTTGTMAVASRKGSRNPAPH